MPVLTLPAVGFLNFTDALVFDNRAVGAGISGSLRKAAESNFLWHSMCFPQFWFPYYLSPHIQNSLQPISAPQCLALSMCTINIGGINA